MVGPARESCSMPYARVSALQRPQEPCSGATLRPGQQAAQRSILELCSSPANLRLPSPGTSAGSPHSSLGSSEPSPQSSSPSHFQRAGMQRPESLQRNSSTPQVIWAAGRGHG